MRIVLDTNVVVSALLWGGTPKRVLQLVAEAEIELVTSDTLIEELGRIFGRAKVAAKLAESQISVAEIIQDYRDRASIVTAALTPVAELRDPKDHHVIAAAVSAGVDLIVSGDKDLLALGTYQGITIISAAEFVRAHQVSVHTTHTCTCYSTSPIRRSA